MKKLFHYIFHSFTNSPDGFSARKLSAFIAVLTAIVLTFKFGEPKYVTELLLIWLAFGLLCLGIITLQQIIDFKNGKTSTSETKPQEQA